MFWICKYINFIELDFLEWVLSEMLAGPLEKEIKFSIEKVAPIFKVFMEFEDEYIKITYDEGTKQGIINIKINAEN